MTKLEKLTEWLESEKNRVHTEVYSSGMDEWKITILNKVLDHIEILDKEEDELPTIPEDVAMVVNESKQHDDPFEWLFSELFDSGVYDAIYGRTYTWLSSDYEKNLGLLAKAITRGFKVEQPKKYRVPFKGLKARHGEQLYLTKLNGYWCTQDFDTDGKLVYQQVFTEEELKDAPFANDLDWEEVNEDE